MPKVFKQLNNIKTQADNSRQFLFKFFLIGSVCLMALYLCFLAVVVNEAVGAKQSFKELNILSSEYQELESQYFASLNEIDLEYAKSLGFVEKSAKVQYAVRPVATALAQR